MNWTTKADVLTKLRKRWTSGEFLTAFAGDRGWEPLHIPLRAPQARDIGANFAAVREWVRAWRAEGDSPLRVEFGPVGGRLIGVNELPRRVWIDDYPSLWAVLGVTAEVDRFMRHVEHTRAVAPRLVDWVISHPHTVLAFTDETWRAVVDTVLWIDALADRAVYVRQVDVPGVDTKFIEANRSVIAALLDLQLDESRVDRRYPAAKFAARYGFLRKPRYVRYRWLTPARTTSGFSELTVRADELLPLAVSRVFVVENEITYLAFPEVEDAIAIFGGGYAVTSLDEVTWLRGLPLVYWGDLDTHGFAILDALRRRFPNAESMLMDRATLLDHESHWAREDKPVNSVLPALTPAEAALYRDLVEGTFGESVRLEQERIRYSAISAALGALGSGHADRSHQVHDVDPQPLGELGDFRR
ncbi:DUF3322 and DUF2220 domain-containing protein [Saccharothrix mutabilis subsp. mutabilis]|uniref:DUF3322 and DUF2220 domain-containing protein n=1 Tax=Saccharothrix mutabilis subsp. mutabilis TaxID=66855 RepID=A0ABN0UDS2_9PSEU